jgi:DNA repair photolyase
MALTESKGNMYTWVTHTWNTVKGECPHGCTYCYMKRWGKQKPVRFDESELKTDLGTGKFIFVGSSCDMFAKGIPDLWINKTLKHMEQFDNKYLIQSKNPDRILDYIHCTVISDKTVVCTTTESDSYYPEIMKDSPHPMSRSIAMQDISEVVDTYVTIEPIMDFHLEHMVKMIRRCHPKQVNIGADSGNNHLPEPSKEKLMQLIEALKEFTIIDRKTNLSRLLK